MPPTTKTFIAGVVAAVLVIAFFVQQSGYESEAKRTEPTGSYRPRMYGSSDTNN